MKKNYELEAWKDAVWDYVLEHCDITESGVLFVKFHTDSRKKFESRIYARYKNYYHRGDPREREEEMNVNKMVHKTLKSQKKEKIRTEKEERIKMKAQISAEIKKVAKINARNSRWNRIKSFFKRLVI